MATEIWVNIGSGNGLLFDGTKPLPEPMLTDHQWSPVTLILGQFHKRCLNHQSLKSVWKLHVYNSIQISQGQWVNMTLHCNRPTITHRLATEFIQAGTDPCSETCLVGLLIRSIFRENNCMGALAQVQFFQRKIERINRPTRHVLL